MGHVFHTIGSFLGHNIGPIIGGTLGTLVAPGIGTAIGAGLGSEGQGLAKGKPFGQATLGALETGGEVYGGSELLGAGASAAGLTGAGAGAGAGASGAASSGILSGLGSDISSGLQSVGLGGIGPALSGIGTDISTGASNLGTSLGLTGPGGLTSEISSGWNQLTGGASNLLGGGTAGTQAVGGGAAVSNPALASTLESVPGNIASTAANAPTISQGGGGILSALTGGGGAGGKGLFGGSPLEAMFAAAPIALKVLQGNQPYKGETQLQQSAAQLGQQGTQLQSYLQTGTLPPGAQAAINQAVAASQAAIRSQYASMGGSGSSAEQQDLQNAQLQGVAQANQMAQSLLSSGIQESQMSDELYQNIMNQSMQEDQNLSTAIGNFAAMAAGATTPAAAAANAALSMG